MHARRPGVPGAWQRGHGARNRAQAARPATHPSRCGRRASRPAHGRYFVAEDAPAPVGQLMVTYEWSDWRNGQFWWIQSVYVLPAARRSGVFRALYDHVDALARSTPGVCGLRLYVESTTWRAAHLPACGMEDAGYRVFEVDNSGAIKRAQGDERAEERNPGAGVRPRGPGGQAPHAKVAAGQGPPDPLLLPSGFHARLHQGSLHVSRPAERPGRGRSCGSSASARRMPSRTRNSRPSTTSTSRCWPTRTRRRSRPTTSTALWGSAYGAAPT